MNALLALATGAILAGAPVAGIPYDPDRSWWGTEGCAVRFCGNDKLRHAGAGALIVAVSLTADRAGSCGARAGRAMLRAQFASAGYELGAALVHRDRWGQPGYGIGLRDHLAVTAGSGLAAAGYCLARKALQ